MSISNVSGPGGVGGGLGMTGNASPKSAAKASGDAAAQAFMDYMQKSPAERMQDAWLQEHGISEDEFNAMPADKKQAVMDEMKKDLADETRRKAELSEQKAAAGGASAAKASSKDLGQNVDVVV